MVITLQLPQTIPISCLNLSQSENFSDWRGTHSLQIQSVPEDPLSEVTRVVLISGSEVYASNQTPIT